MRDGGVLDSMGTACSPDTSGFDACFDAGEIYAFDAPFFTTCAGLTVRDLPGVFQWACDDSQGFVRAYTTGVSLPRAVSTTGLVAITPTIEETATGNFLDGPTLPLWPNPVDASGTSDQISAEGTIVILGPASTSVTRTILANRVTVVVPEGERYTHVGTLDPVIMGSGRDFIRIEGDIFDDNGEGGETISLTNTRFFTARVDVESPNGSVNAIVLNTCNQCEIRESTLETISPAIVVVNGTYVSIEQLELSDSHGIDVDDSEHVRLNDFTIDGTRNSIRVDNTNDVWLHDGRISNTTNRAIDIVGGIGVRLSDLHVFSVPADAIRITGSTGVVVKQVTLANGSASGFVGATLDELYLEAALIGGFASVHGLELSNSTDAQTRDLVLTETNAPV
ncbi:MAG: right-handed parallel beta-helix repeat-containing protein, partial [Myxococcota bacterium]